MTKIHELSKYGQSIWFDYIRRAFIVSGEFESILEEGVVGVTSNPSIFEKAIAGSVDYDRAMKPLIEAGKSVEEIYEALALEDIAQAADLLRPIYDLTNGLDGYVSLEVSPKLANDTEETIAEARRLFSALDRPNVMIKVPATDAGIPAITALIGEGINVNVTLIFSTHHYEAVAKAYIKGLEKLSSRDGDLSRVSSVASFFVSRVDTAVDKNLSEIGNEQLLGKIAVANSKVAYALYQELFSGEQWERLAAQGARPQRVLWASTGTKNQAYSDTKYVDELIGPDTVNTIPPATLQAYLEHGNVALTLSEDVASARGQLAELESLGISLDAITQELQDAGVDSFSKSFDSLMESIKEKRDRLQSGEQDASANLGSYDDKVNAALAEMKKDEIMRRIWAHDHTVWADYPAEISNRLGWLRIPQVMMDNLHVLNDFVETVRRDGYTHVLLLGMGGSSLAPEVFRNTFGVAEGYLDLSVLDSTDPGAVLEYDTRLDYAKTLFIVATKSGGTVETLSFFKYFYNRTADVLGEDKAGEHFVAITDPGSKLVQLAEKYKFRATFQNDPNIGGRYSALSYFGLVPAALVGVDVHELLDRALTMVCNCESCNCPLEGDNKGAWLGSILGELTKEGRDKVTFVLSPQITSFADWVEQLIAESTGKAGKGILPVAGESLTGPEKYRDDRLFVYLQLEGDSTFDDGISQLENAGYPVVRLKLRDLYDLGGQYFLWEMATAVAGYRLGIQPYNQPNVEAAKVLARKMVAEYQETGSLPKGESVHFSEEKLANFLSQAKPGDYISIQAYLKPSEDTTRVLQQFRDRLRDETKLATTLGYGPRFLHSTGQLHKGDGGNGLFIQFTSDNPQDANIPDEAGKSGSSLTFGLLISAQAQGDYQALLQADPPRRVIRFNLTEDGLKTLPNFSR